MRALSLLSGAALSAAVLTACDSGATEPPFLPETSPTPAEEATSAPEATPAAVPTPTAIPGTLTPAPESGGLDGFRAFAARVESALAEGDASFFADRGLEDEMTCAGDEQLGPCVDQPAGTVLRGIPGALWQSDAFWLFSPNEYAAMLGDWLSGARADLADEYGDGGVRLFAIGQPAAGDADQKFLAIMTAILDTGPASETQRQARILRFLLSDGVWRLNADIFAATGFTSKDWLSGKCRECYDRWERWEGTP